MSYTCLIVAEKPSIAEAIAKAISKGSSNRNRGPTPVHTWSGPFQGKDCFFRCLGVTGHIMDVDFGPEYRSWDKTDPRDLFDAPVITKPSGNGKMKRHLENNAKGIDFLFLWLDCDREGENICFEVIGIVDRFMSNRVHGQVQ